MLSLDLIVPPFEGRETESFLWIKPMVKGEFALTGYRGWTEEVRDQDLCLLQRSKQQNMQTSGRAGRLG